MLKEECSLNAFFLPHSVHPSYSMREYPKSSFQTGPAYFELDTCTIFFSSSYAEKCPPQANHSPSPYTKKSISRLNLSSPMLGRTGEWCRRVLATAM